MKETVMNIRFQNITVCPACGSDQLNGVMRGRDHDTLSLKYTILQCPKCRACITNPQPHPDDIWKLYDERNSPDFAPSLKGIVLLRQYFFKRRINKILKNIPGDELMVLDYGCGDGLLSLLLSQHPRCKQVTASDFHSEAPHYIKQPSGNIRYMPHQDFVKGTERYDLILCRQVLEHVHDPVTCLSAFRARMNPGSWIIVEVPNFQTVWRSVFGPNWSMLYLPRHLLHYTPASLCAVLEKSGFSVRKLKRSHFPGMQSSIYHSLGKHSPAPGPLAVLLFPLQVFLDCLFRSSSEIAAYAQPSGPGDASWRPANEPLIIPRRQKG